MKSVLCKLEINVSPETGIRAFTDPAMLGAWWGVDRAFIECKPGGIYTLAWKISDAGFKYISTGVIREYVPARLLHVGDYMYLNPERPFLGPIELTVKADPLPGGCLLELEQGPYPEGAGPDWDWYYEVVKNAWPRVLPDLKNYLEKNFT